MQPRSVSTVVPISSHHGWNTAAQFLYLAGCVTGIALVAWLGWHTFSLAWERAYIGFGFDAESGRITRVATFSAPDAPLPVHMGDRLTHIEGVPLWEAYPLYPGKAVGEQVEYTVQRAGATQRLSVPLRAPSRTIVATRLAQWGIGAAFWVLGVLVYLRRTHQVLGRVFLLLSLAVASIVFLLPLVSWHIPWALRGFYVTLALVGVLFCHLHLLFPRPVRHPAPLTALRLHYGIAGLFIGLTMAVEPVRLAEIARQRGWAGDVMANGLRAYCLISLTLGIAYLVAAYRTGGTARRRVRLIVGATLVAIVPLLVSFLVALLSPWTIPSFLPLLALVLLPIAYTLAMQQDRLASAEGWLYYLAQYTILALLLGVVYLALLALLGYVGGDALLQAPLVSAAVGVAVAFLLTPLQMVVRSTMYRLLYGTHDTACLLTTALRHLATSNDLATVATVLQQDIAVPLGIDASGVWVRDQQQGWQPLRSTLPPHPPLPTALLAQLERGVAPSLATSFLDDPHPWQWVVPLQVADEVVGVWLLGTRANRNTLGPADQEMVQVVAQKAALVVQVQRLVLEVQAQMACIEADRAALQHAYGQLVTAREEQRAHIARELHDTLLQDLHGFGLLLKRLQSSPCTLEAVREELERMRGQVRVIVQDTRRLCHDLYPVTLEKYPLSYGLHALLSEMGRKSSGTAFLLDMTFVAPLALEEKVTVYRIIQEALNNVCKHAAAERATVTLHQTDGIHLTIRDNGVGFDPTQVAGQYMGLSGMRHRVLALGGTIAIDSAPGKGTTIQVVVPRLHTEEEVSDA